MHVVKIPSGLTVKQDEMAKLKIFETCGAHCKFLNFGS
jgi:hypothetical protein